MNPKSLYRAALLECLSYVCLSDSAEARAAYRTISPELARSKAQNIENLSIF